MDRLTSENLETEICSSPNKGRLGGVLNCNDFELIPIPTPSLNREGSNKSANTLPLTTLPNQGGRLAFTLAEVLITLGVIGIVSALTMPSVINNFQVSAWESGLKKSYATITNGFHAIASENGGDLRNSGLFDDVDDETFSDRMDEAVRKHFVVVKTYGTKYKVERIKNLGEFEFPFEVHYKVYLNNGAIFTIQNDKCTETAYKNESNLKYSCARIVVDINGEKRPNVTGKDVFYFGSMNEKGDVYPDTSLEWAKSQVGNDNALTYKSYWRNNAGQCGTPNKKIKDETVAQISGQNCLARIMENGWKMDYLK